ncbi:hypothetical protein [Metasolibacillus meyeri]|uniref:hypothetical protein n=1 Tax=Metasolibacillus meyeri TaxID=1071052 RepID=UPI000D2FBC89|nr:hypothetical protein [Metasolibacillus meyeri]
MNFDLTIFDTTVIPAIIFIIWIIVQAGLPKKFAPIVSLALGVAGGLTFVGFSPEGFVAGVLLGAAAIGFHSGTKNILQGGAYYDARKR